MALTQIALELLWHYGIEDLQVRCHRTLHIQRRTQTYLCGARSGCRCPIKIPSRVVGVVANKNNHSLVVSAMVFNESWILV